MNWNIEEINYSLSLLKLGNSYKDISLIINRSESSIRNKMNEIGEKSSSYRESILNFNCLYCNSLFKDRSIIDRKFCSHSCNAKFNNKLRGNIIIYKCKFCSEDLNRKKLYCNNKCYSLYKKNLIAEEIQSGNILLPESNYKKYLINKYGEVCMECGWNKKHKITKKVPIQLEHIDGNSTNNSLHNLKLLCPNCHSLTTTYGALNKGNGRKNRKR